MEPTQLQFLSLDGLNQLTRHYKLVLLLKYTFLRNSLKTIGSQLVDHNLFELSITILIKLEKLSDKDVDECVRSKTHRGFFF